MSSLLESLRFACSFTVFPSVRIGVLYHHCPLHVPIQRLLQCKSIAVVRIQSINQSTNLLANMYSNMQLLMMRYNDYFTNFKHGSHEFSIYGCKWSTLMFQRKLGPNTKTGMFAHRCKRLQFLVTASIIVCRSVFATSYHGGPMYTWYTVVMADGCKWAFTRSDRRTDRSVQLVCPTGRSDDRIV